MSSGGESENMINCLNWCEENKVSYGVLTGFSENNTIRKNAKILYGITILIVIVMV